MHDLADLPTSPVLDLLCEIDRQQDEVLQALADLNLKLESILNSCSPAKEEILPLPKPGLPLLRAA